MAKHNKQSKRHPTTGFGAKTPSLETELRRVKKYVSKNEWDAACNLLLSLTEKYPQNVKIWEYFANASLAAGDTRVFQKACEGLFALQPSADTAYALGRAYISNKHPLMALQIFRQALALDPEHEMASQATAAIEQLEPMMEDTLADMRLPGTEGLEIALLHERGQAYLEQGDYAASRAAEEEVLERQPQFMSARNNLSLLSWLEGDVDAAISMAQAVLDCEPDNIHALANLIHFLAFSGETEVAQTYAERLKASHAEAWDGWTKKVEGLTYLADDAGIVAVWQQAQTAEVEDSPASALFYHLSAVALARSDNTDEAIEQWKTALKRNPGLTLAQENLNDIRKPIAQRHGAWPLNWQEWLMPSSSEELHQTITTSLEVTHRDDQISDSQVNTLISSLIEFLDTHPEVIAMLPRILERGGPHGQEFVLKNAEQLKTPALLSSVKDFALGQSGTDQMRMRAANLVAQAKLMPKDKATLWIDGNWQEIMLIAYEMHSDPITKHSEEVEGLLVEAINLLHQSQAQPAAEAEILLNQAIELEPEAPDLMNNLARAVSTQGREEEAEALIRELITRYPDYVFASATLAKLHLGDGEVEAAEALLKPFLIRDRFHILEFSAFADAYIEVLLVKNQLDGARSWLEMWEQVNSRFQARAPRLSYWKQQLSGSRQSSSGRKKTRKR